VANKRTNTVDPIAIPIIEPVVSSARATDGEDDGCEVEGNVEGGNEIDGDDEVGEVG